jgi:hypothetical protein
MVDELQHITAVHGASTADKKYWLDQYEGDYKTTARSLTYTLPKQCTEG